MDSTVVINRIKRTADRRHPGSKYKIIEYKNFYSLVVDGYEPSLFEKEDGFPVRMSYGQLKDSDIVNPKIVYESGGQKDGKK